MFNSYFFRRISVIVIESIKLVGRVLNVNRITLTLEEPERRNVLRMGLVKEKNTSFIFRYSGEKKEGDVNCGQNG